MLSLDLRRALLIAATLAASGCATFAPPVDLPQSFFERLVTRTSGDITVFAVVPSDDEVDGTFNAALGENDI